MRKMRDVIDDDERKIRPTSLLMLTSATILGAMIIYNALASNGSRLMSQHATTRMQVSAPEQSTNTVVFKYDADVENVQRELLATGHYKGLVDGVMGQRTQLAITSYQHDNALQETGQVSADLINHIRYTRKIKAAAEFTGSVEPMLAAEPEAAPVFKPAIAQAVAIKPSKQQQVLRAQMTLANLGYDLGEPTGTLDEETHAAILKFQMDNGLAMDGKVDSSLLTALTKSSN